MDARSALREFRARGDLEILALRLLVISDALAARAAALLRSILPREEGRGALRVPRRRTPGAVPVLVPRMGRIVLRPPTAREFRVERDWAAGLRERAEEAVRVLAALAADLLREVEMLREKLSRFLSEGKRNLSLRDLAADREEAAACLISLLLLEREGEIEIHQDVIYGDLKVTIVENV